jgi:hypothetical protein
MKAGRSSKHFRRNTNDVADSTRPDSSLENTTYTASLLLPRYVFISCLLPAPLTSHSFGCRGSLSSLLEVALHLLAILFNTAIAGGTKACHAIDGVHLTAEKLGSGFCRRLRADCLEASC